MSSKLLENKAFLYMTEFFSGMSVMAVELGASRLLAPYFSSSQIIYTIIIGTVMIAMALGNLYGGRSADRDPDPARLYRRMLIASIWIAAIPFAGRYIILLISGLLILSSSTGFLTAAAFASCMALFVFPLFLLGTVTPSLVRYILENAGESGEVVGRLGAFNTIGSILGTFLPTFVTIPAFGTSASFVIFSGVLLLLSLAYFLSAGGFGKRAAALTAVFVAVYLLSANASFAFWEDELLYEGDSVYNYLQVKEDDESVILSTNVLFGVQSIMMKDGGLTGMYYDYALAAPVMASAASDGEALDILILGNGSGTFASQCSKYFPGSDIEGVEIDGKITELAYRYFDMPESVSTFEYDGRAFIQQSEKLYDVILVDAYQDITIPFQMSSREFFSLVNEHLKDGGVMVVNMNMHSDGEGSINEYLSDTICGVFGSVCTVDVPHMSNRELFALKSGNSTDPAELLKQGRAEFAGDASPEAEDVYSLCGDISERLRPCVMSENAYLLTDDKAPVELLGKKMIDSLIDEELSYYRGIYEREGLRGLVDYLI